MKTTKEDILNVSVKLFARQGFDAVSTSMIASELGITKGALYRHFKNKQEIFDCIISKMIELDAKRAEEDSVPKKEYDNNPLEYKNTEFSDFCGFVINQFDFWTDNEFASDFRRMITLEQFKNPEMNRLYQDVIGMGPVNYSADLLKEMIVAGKLKKEAGEFGTRNLAIQLFAPLQLMLVLYDGGADRDELKLGLLQLTKDFENRWKS